MEQRTPQKQDSDVSALIWALVDKLKTDELVRMPSVETAFRVVPRHLFVPDVPLEEVYSDRALPTKKDDDGRWLSSSSQPTIMAIMLDQLDLEPGHKVLEIGAGTGYNAALMAHIVGRTGHVVTVDIEEDLVAAARENLAKAGLNNVQVVCADGGYGYRDLAPYDRIILTVGAPDILPAWKEQVKPGGRLVLPLAVARGQLSVAFERDDDHLVSLSVHGCGFMLLRGAFARAHVPPVQLGSDPGLYLRVVRERKVDEQKVFDWLAGLGRDWETGVKVTMREVFFGLGTWLSLQDPESCALVAEGDWVDRNIVPPLMGVGGERKSAHTEVLLGERGMAALMRPPGEAVPLMDVDSLFAADSPFDLFVRQFGADATLPQRLIEHVGAWDAAGRPTLQDLRIRAYSKDADYAPSEDELVVEREWTRFVLEWTS